MAVVLPSRKVKQFEGFFLGDDLKENQEKQRYFARTFLSEADEEKNAHGMSLLRIRCMCAWSAGTCLVDGYPGKKEDHECVGIKEAIDECEVKRLILYSEEPGCLLAESITYDREQDGEVRYDSRDLFERPGDVYLEDDEADEEKETEMG